MTMKPPCPMDLRVSSFRASSPEGGDWSDDADQTEREPGLWTGTRDGITASIVAFLGAVLFGGAAGVWFAPGESGLLMHALILAVGSILMGSLVCLSGSLVSGRKPIFWGVGMPFLVYFAGTIFALLSGYAGAGMLLLGGPVFVGLAIAAGVMVAFVLDRD
jgi:hypothetical protein